MDLAKFINEPLAARTQTIAVPELEAFFGPGDKPEWTVRGLTAAELGRARLAAERGTENMRALIEAFAGDGDKAEALRRAAGVSEAEVPEDVSRRLEMLVAGSVEPQLGIEYRDVAVKLAESFPTVFYNLTNAIVNLTGQGAEVGKRPRSGKARKSAH